MSKNNTTALWTKVQNLENRKTPFQSVIEQSHQQQPRLVELKNQRLQTLAEAMVAGIPAPDVTRLDAEIVLTEKAILNDCEKAEIATNAIQIIEAQINAAKAEISDLSGSVRRRAIEALQIEFCGLIKKYEAYASELQDQLSAIPKRPPADGLSVTFNQPPGEIPVSVGKGGSYQLDDKLFSNIESVLRQAGGIAHVQHDFLNDYENRDSFYAILSALSRKLIEGVRERNLSVPDWAFSGRLPIDDGLTEAISRRLIVAGVRVPTVAALEIMAGGR